jgi:hypothetical protein
MKAANIANGSKEGGCTQWTDSRYRHEAACSIVFSGKILNLMGDLFNALLRRAVQRLISSSINMLKCLSR